MKKTIVALMLIFALLMPVIFAGCAIESTAVPTPTPAVFAFDRPDWLIFGMKEGDVRSHYNDDPVSSGNLIYYSSIGLGEKYRDYGISEISYNIWYGFSNNNELVLLSYSIDLDQSFGVDERPYMDEYNWLINQISSKYGEPISSSDKWFNEKYKNDEAMLNTAIARGDCANVTLWRIDNVFISITLYKTIDINYTNDQAEWFYIGE